MNGNNFSFGRGDRGPWKVVGGLPVYASTALVAGYTAALLLGVFAGMAGAGWEAAARFSVPTALWGGQFWQFLTYPLCNRPSVWFVLEMLLLYRFGREVEEFLGRRVFLRLYLLQVLAPPLCLTVIHLVWAVLSGGGLFTGSPGAQPGALLGLAGSSGLHFALFFAYAALFPGIPVFFGFRAIWVAVILLAVYSLERLSLAGAGGGGLALGELVVLWVGSVGGALYATWEKGVWSFPSARPGWLRGLFRRPPRFVVVRGTGGAAVPGETGLEGMECGELLALIDPLLEKISRSGLSSLTPGERARLEAARAELMRKETVRR